MVPVELQCGDMLSLDKVEVMRTWISTMLAVGVGAIPIMGAAPGVSAAELSLQQPSRAVVVHHRKAIRHHSRLVRDLDGTPILLRRLPEFQRGYDGPVRLTAQYEAVPVRGAAPSHYLNGQPVLPHCPRFWPRSSCSRG